MDDEFEAFKNVVVWKISKVERTHPIGVSKYTVTQELYDAEDWSARLIDSVRLTDDPDSTLGLDYYYNGRQDSVSMDDVGKVEITYAGNGTIHVGMTKSFTAHFYNDNDEEQDVIPTWQLDYVDNFDGLSTTVSDDGKVFTVKCNRTYSLIGKTFSVQALYDERFAAVEIEVVG